MSGKPAGLPFLRLPERSPKPRRSGLTVVKDRRLPETAARGLVDTCADIIDWVKYTDHAGLIDRVPAAVIRARVELYHAGGLPVRPGGIPFQIAVLQGQAERYFDRLHELGFDGVELSEDSIEPLGAQRKRQLIGRALDSGLTVFTELGRKISDGPLPLDETERAVHADLDAGASHVTIENTDLLVWLDHDPARLDRLVEAVGLTPLVFEARPAGWPEVAAGLLRRYGPEVSFENLQPEDATVIDSMRIGMTRDVDYWFLTKDRAATAPDNPDR